MCAEAIGDEHSHVVDIEKRSLMCTCRGCYLLFTPEGAGGGHFRAVPDRYLSFPDFAARARALGGAADPGQRRVLLPELRDGAGRRVLSEPGRGHRVVARPGDLGRGGRRPTPSWRSLIPDVEAFLVRTDQRGEAKRRVLPRTDRRLLRARRPAPPAVARLRRRQGGARGARRVLRRGAAKARPSSGGDAHERGDLRSRRGRSRAVRRSCQRSTCACASPRRLARRCTRVALRCQIMIEPQRRRYGHGEEERLVELFGEAPRWGDTLKPFLWTHVGDRWFPASPTRSSSTWRSRARTTSRSRRRSTSPVCEDGEIPILLLFSGTVFAKRTGDQAALGVRRAPVAWHEEARYRVPVATWREMMDLYFPNSGWVRVGRETLDALQRFKAARGLHTWEHAFERLLKEAGGGGSVSRRDRFAAGTPGGRRRAVRGVRAVPVPRLGSQEPDPLAVRRARPAPLGRGQRWRALLDAHGGGGRPGHGRLPDRAHPLPPGAAPHRRRRRARPAASSSRSKASTSTV